VSEVKRGIWYRLYHGETAFDFVGHRRRWFTFSAVIILAGLVALIVSGLSLSIDFKGGTVWEVPAKRPGSDSVAAARNVMKPLGLGEATIQVLTPAGGGTKTMRVEAHLTAATDADRAAKVEAVTDALAKFGGTDINQVTLNDVGPSWGSDISSKAIRALVLFFIVVTIYIVLRFEAKMAIAAFIALVHDILVTVGIYAISGFTVSPATVIAFLTILGYSLYDTIVVFDRVQENTRGLASTGRLTYTDTVNLSMNQVLMRSLNTSIVAILPILSVLVIGAFALGATTLQDFGLALFIGLTTGAYSSIFIASPILAMLKEREPRYAAIRNRLSSRATGPALTPAAAAAGGFLVPAAGVAREPAATPRREVRPARAAPAPAPAPVYDDDDGPAAPTPVTKPAGGQARPAARPGGGRPAPRPRKKGKRR
jgi:preprotein translocase subunit SecF